jgi:hypothetical protein
VYSRSVLRTVLSQPQAERQLAALVRPRMSREWRIGRPIDADRAMVFVGHVGDGRFKFHRVISGSRGFELIVTGRVVDRPGGAELHMVLRLAFPVVIWAIAWLAAITLATTTTPFDAVPFVFFSLSMLVLTLYFFVQEKRRTLQVLREAFPGSILCKDAVR